MRLVSFFSAIALQQAHGAATRVAADATAFPHRYDHFCMYVHPATDDPADANKIVRWGRECWDGLQAFVEPAVYINALEDALEEGEHRVRQRYDPTNFFAGNQNIKGSA